MFSFSFPQWEIHNSKEPVCMMIYPSRKIQAYKLKPLGGQYFYIQEGKKFKGIFELDQTKAYTKTYAVVMAISREKGVEMVDVYEKSINKTKFKMFL